VVEPTPEELTAALEAAEREEKKREEELATPQAEEEREASQEAFTSLSAAEAKNLLTDEFAEQLNNLNADPARALSDVEVEQTLGIYAAKVAGPDGSSELLESPIPITVAQADGKPEAVDLTLQPDGGEFVPRNPVTLVRLPATASGAVHLEGGISIGLPGANDPGAIPFEEKSLFFPSTDADTDTILAPITGGVEAFEQLRSPESPETFRYSLSIPAGAELKPSGGEAEVVDGSGHTIAVIPPPSAVDAQGVEVPVSLSVDGDSLVVSIPHNSPNLTYPLLLDPILEAGEGWYAGSNSGSLAQWTWAETGSQPYFHTTTSCTYMCWGTGLYTHSKGESAKYAANTWGQWEYTAPNSTSFITSATFSPIDGEYHDLKNCYTNQPHGYVGIYNVYEGYKGHGAIGSYSPPSGTNMSFSTSVGATGTRKAVVGIGTGEASSTLKCGHEFWVGGTSIWLSDEDTPTISSVSGVPSGWIKDSTNFTIKASSGDPGLGIRYVTIAPEGTSVIQDQVGCSGVRTSACPESRASTFNLTGTPFAQGKRKATLTAEDPVGHVSTAYPFETMVDRSAPEVALSGQLASATKEELEFGEKEKPQSEGNDELSLPIYNLKIEAKDGSNAEASTMRSGVKNIEVFLDGKAQEVPWSSQSCPASSCKMEKTFPLKMEGLQATEHTLRVVVEDQVGNKLERNIEFKYVPATGMSDEYLMQHFPLGGSEEEAEEGSRPELAVNIMNGNLVYHERDIDIEGYGADLEVERYYNSMLPTGQNTEWGDGWTLAQTPALKPASGEKTPSKGEFVESSGAIKGAVSLPTTVGESKFNSKLKATVTKLSSGYKLTDETGEAPPAVTFNESGKAEETRTEGYAKVKYGYTAGKLSGIAVKDPASDSRAITESKSATSAPTYTSAFGSSGTGNGQFSHPAGIALDAKGNLWVVDENQYRVEKFNEAGEFFSAFGSQGTENGKFSRPTDVAVDAKGNLWVTDAGNSRIEEFNEKGEFVAKVGSAGSGNLQFSGPESIAIDAKGNIWVGDTYNHRVQELNEKGEFIRAFGSNGSGQGQIVESTGIAVGPGGNVWVADWGNNRVEEFSETGSFIRQFGSEGTGNGQFKRPDVIDVDSRGNVWVGDQNNNRIQEFNQSGEYVAQFGSTGSGNGQFKFGWPMGIADNGKGSLWIADTGNNRVQRWQVPNYVPTYTSTFGSDGSGNGQFYHPAGIAFDANGNLWVADENHYRVEEFNGAGEFLNAFGSQGTEDGKFSRPTDVAVDPTGDIWVTDASNNRIEEFSETGKFLQKIGASGSGKGQFSGPESIAIDAKGNIWVGDTYNSRLQEFNETGDFVRIAGSYGKGPGQIIESTGIDIGPGGNVWVADWGNNRVEEFSETGAFIQQFGTEGTGNGQFKRPDVIDVDPQGNVWVADEGNGRVQEFNQSGEYVTQFGSKGTETGQFTFGWPMGIADNGKGTLWIADAGNARVQRWQDGTYVPSAEEGNDPAVEIATTSGLVSKVEGPEAGQNAYSYSGDDLVEHSGPEGKAKYTYDTVGRMTKVELPDGTYGAIAYEETYGRVKSVMVDSAGSEPAKTTYFSYVDEPRSTTVTPEKEPATTYAIGNDGSVLSWKNAKEPPTLTLSGSLYANRENSSWNSPGDQTLTIEGYAVEGLANLQVFVNGSVLVHENKCSQVKEKPAECVKVTGQWVMNTENFPPGPLFIEAVGTDRLDQTTASRFWVNIPQPAPPPAPGAPIAPTFEKVSKFREEFGLEVIFPVANELERNERIFNLIDAWWAGDPVARSTSERWEVPLRTVDVAELEYREAYMEHDIPLIEEWAKAHTSSIYAGVYVDQKSGGLIRVGFTENQAATISAMKQEIALMAPERLAGFSSTPLHSLASLESLETQLEGVSESWSENLLVSSALDIPGNQIIAGVANVGEASSLIHSALGPEVPVSVEYEEPAVELAWKKAKGPVLAGDFIETLSSNCSAGFGALRSLGNGKKVPLILTAAHCGDPLEAVYRENEGGETQELGGVFLSARDPSGDPNWSADGEAILANAMLFVPDHINIGGGASVAVKDAKPIPIEGQWLCHAGARSAGRVCGKFLWVRRYRAPEGRHEWMVCFHAQSVKGDSGGPVWIEGTNIAVGLAARGRNKIADETFAQTCAAPLLPGKGNPQNRAILTHTSMAPMHLRFAP
jgi:sugar lactone lactonase YvrE